MNIRELDIFEEIDKKYPYIFNTAYLKSNVEFNRKGEIKDTNFSINFDGDGNEILTPLYFRVDLLRCMIAYEQLEKKYCEYFEFHRK